jgi:hypothetical protein
VASVALFAELSAVVIIPLVTDVTPARCARHLFDSLCVAAIAMQCLVGPVYLEFTLGIVIEAPDLPTVGVVALGTGFTQALLVYVIAFMAFVAGGFDCPEIGVRVTSFARGNGMQADKGERCNVMVKDDLLVPTLFVVATAAKPVVAARLAAMHVIDLVTVIAAGG